jgi:regulator of replication initiation timing
MNERIEVAKQLVDVVEQIEKLRETEKQLRDQLLKLMKDNESVQINNRVVTKRVTRETITDPEMLKQLGFDLTRVTVTITKIDPKLVRVIGEVEKKNYYVEKPVIIVAETKQQQPEVKK